MPTHAETIRLRLSTGPLPARQLAENMGLSQPTISRALTELGGEIVKIGAARSIQYALRDSARGLPDMAIYRVDTEGRISQLGTLIAVRPEGFVMRQAKGSERHSDGLPWWLYDMRPQGYLGRAYASRHGAELGLPARLTDWTDTHALRALLAEGHDAVGNLLLGDLARDRFLAAPLAAPIRTEDKAATYARLAQAAAQGDLPGSSAGGEQPKFTSHVLTAAGPRHVIVKFSELEPGPVSERWRDLLLAEHIALETLGAAGIAAATSRIIEHGEQRFLEVERFDRQGDLGRRGLVSLAAMDAEFIGIGTGDWPGISRRLAAKRHIEPAAADGAALLWAFGSLIGNTDMHNGNLSFIVVEGRPYTLAPAYDMTPMAFAPRSGGGLPDRLAPASIHAAIPNETWRQAERLARKFLVRISTTTEFSRRFGPCISALESHLETASHMIGRLG